MPSIDTCPHCEYLRGLLAVAHERADQMEAEEVKLSRELAAVRAALRVFVEELGIDEYRSCGYGWCIDCGVYCEDTKNPSLVDHQNDCRVKAGALLLRGTPDVPR